MPNYKKNYSLKSSLKIEKEKKFLANNSISSVVHCAAYAYVLEGERKKKISRERLHLV